MENRFQIARDHLLDLLKYYGNRTILVKITQDGREVKVWAKTFVRRRIEKTGIPFIFGTGSNRIVRVTNPELDDDMLAVIFHKAVFELERGYIEVFCEGRPQAQRFIDSINGWIKYKEEWLSCTFPTYKEEDLVPFITDEITFGTFSAGLEVKEEDANTLRELGYDSISDVREMAELFWDFAVRREPIGRLMKNAILAITLDEQAANYLSTNFRKLNGIIQEHIDNDGLMPDEKIALDDMQDEILKVRREANKKVKAAKKGVQEDMQYLRKLRKVAKKLKKLLLNPLSTFTRTYDFTKEEDINGFLKWFKLMERHVPMTFVRQMEKRYYQEPGQLDMFKQRVEEHNLQFPVDVPDDEIDDEETEECTEL